MVEHEAAERRELARPILELPTEALGPGIGLADVGVAGELGPFRFARRYDANALAPEARRRRSSRRSRRNAPLPLVGRT
jgi:hypothetical protein